MTHKEAIDIVRTQYSHDSIMKEALGLLIPELAESEDEKIRKWLYNYFSKIGKIYWFYPDITCEELLAWLEKRKEIFESGKGLYYYDGEKTTYCGCPATEENPYDFATSQQEKQKEKKPVEHLSVRDEFDLDGNPKQKSAEWSKEDENTINELCNIIVSNSKNGYLGRYYAGDLVEKLKSLRPQPKPEWSEEDEKEYNYIMSYLDTAPKGKQNHASKWLKKRRPQPHWKPSEEQMKALDFAVTYLFSTKQNPTYLRDLYNDLKKLIKDKK